MSEDAETKVIEPTAFPGKEMKVGIISKEGWMKTHEGCPIQKYRYAGLEGTFYMFSCIPHNKLFVERFSELTIVGDPGETGNGKDEGSESTDERK